MRRMRGVLAWLVCGRAALALVAPVARNGHASTLKARAAAHPCARRSPVLCAAPSDVAAPGRAARRGVPKVAVAAALATCGVALRPAFADAAVARVWRSVLAVPLAHNCMLEAGVASFGFLAAIVFWSSIHLWLWPSATQRKSAMRRFRIDGHAPVAAFEWLGQLGVKRMLGAWLPLVVYMASVRLFHLVVVKPPLPLVAPSFLRLATEIVMGIAAYDLAFAPLHASFHSANAPKWWKGIHHTHHVARPEARAGKSLVIVNVLVQRYVRLPVFTAAGIVFLPKHPLSRLAHNLLVTYLLAEAHSGYDLPWMSHRLLPRVFGGAKAHDAHHVHKAPLFHQFFQIRPKNGAARDALRRIETEAGMRLVETDPLAALSTAGQPAPAAVVLSDVDDRVLTTV
ncbi:hypothetical protein M885DRAFT_161339 [Pelagophyceae sp. CCMP2097]|nr:hypothetical protein M885DRAFT_161339 [Pelagophyceae sp. CCMP2097]